jgi:hypothetical protein
MVAVSIETETQPYQKLLNEGDYLVAESVVKK